MEGVKRGRLEPPTCPLQLGLGAILNRDIEGIAFPECSADWGVQRDVEQRFGRCGKRTDDADVNVLLTILTFGPVNRASLRDDGISGFIDRLVVRAVECGVGGGGPVNRGDWESTDITAGNRKDQIRRSSVVGGVHITAWSQTKYAGSSRSDTSITISERSALALFLDIAVIKIFRRHNRSALLDAIVVIRKLHVVSSKEFDAVHDPSGILGVDVLPAHVVTGGVTILVVEEVRAVRRSKIGSIKEAKLELVTIGLLTVRPNRFGESEGLEGFAVDTRNQLLQLVTLTVHIEGIVVVVGVDRAVGTGTVFSGHVLEVIDTDELESLIIGAVCSGWETVSANRVIVELETKGVVVNVELATFQDSTFVHQFLELKLNCRGVHTCEHTGRTGTLDVLADEHVFENVLGDLVGSDEVFAGAGVSFGDFALEDLAVVMLKPPEGDVLIGLFVPAACGEAGDVTGADLANSGVCTSVDHGELVEVVVVRLHGHVHKGACLLVEVLIDEAAFVAGKLFHATLRCGELEIVVLRSGDVVTLGEVNETDAITDGIRIVFVTEGSDADSAITLGSFLVDLDEIPLAVIPVVIVERGLEGCTHLEGASVIMGIDHTTIGNASVHIGGESLVAQVHLIFDVFLLLEDRHAEIFHVAQGAGGCCYRHCFISVWLGR